MTLPTMTCINITLKLLNLPPEHEFSVPFFYFYSNYLPQYCLKIVGSTSFCTQTQYPFFIFLQLFKLITLLTMTFIDTALKLLNLPAHKLSIPFLYFYRNLHQFCPKIVEPTSCTNLAYIFCTFIEIICIDTALKLLNLPASAHKHSMYTFYSIFTEII